MVEKRGDKMNYLFDWIYKKLGKKVNEKDYYKASDNGSESS